MGREAYKLSEADARAILAKLDANLGYPKAGVNIGKGKHVSPDKAITKRYTYLLRHADGKQVSIPSDPVIDAAITRAAIETAIIVPPKERLDTTWDDAKHEKIEHAATPDLPDAAEEHGKKK